MQNAELAAMKRMALGTPPAPKRVRTQAPTPDSRSQDLTAPDAAVASDRPFREWVYHVFGVPGRPGYLVVTTIDGRTQGQISGEEASQANHQTSRQRASTSRSRPRFVLAPRSSHTDDKILSSLSSRRTERSGCNTWHSAPSSAGTGAHRRSA